jgi:hypothetical protein
MSSRVGLRLPWLAVMAIFAFSGCAIAAIPSRPAWPVAPEVLPSATSGELSSEFGKGTWAIDPAFGSPGPTTSVLHVLVWEVGCSSDSPTTGRMSAPIVKVDSSTITITIGVRPKSGVQTCPGPQGTPAVVNLPEPLGERTLLDGGSNPPAPPSPRFPAFPPQSSATKSVVAQDIRRR